MKGKWIGEYTYREGYPDSYIGKSVRFYFDLTSNGVEFEGFFTDDETKKIFDTPGTVHGYLEGNTLIFSIWYPCLWQIDVNGVIEIFKDLPSHEIYYSGDLENNLAKGDWEIPSTFIDDDGNYIEVLGKGTWSMKKV